MDTAVRSREPSTNACCCPELSLTSQIRQNTRSQRLAASSSLSMMSLRLCWPHSYSKTTGPA